MIKKLLTIIILLIIINIFAYRYLIKIINTKNPYIYKEINEPILYQKGNIKIKNDDDFHFDNYFVLLNTNNKNITVDIQDKIYIYLSNIKYEFNFERIEPEIIEKIIYKKDENSNSKEQLENDVCEDVFYVDSNYLCFSLETDFELIRQTLAKNIHTSYETTIDYSRLNVSAIGQYSVYYISEYKKIEIIIEIM